MPNIGTVLREEIVRLARKEVRRETLSMQKASSQYRRDIAALKRQVTRLERQVSLLENQVLAKPPEPAPAKTDSRVRFTAKGLRSQRKRLGLSAADYAKLAGVATQTVYSWEREATRPSKDQTTVLAALRSMGKLEAAARLQHIAKQDRKPKKQG